LLKIGGGPLVINSTNSYTGPTDIQLGTLLLANAGSIAASPTINVAPGATLNVQGTSSLCPVPTGQTLTGNGTVVGPILIAGKLAPTLAASGLSFPQAMLFSNRLVLAGETTLNISRNAAFNQTIKVAGEVQYGGVLTVSTDSNNFFPTGQVQTFRLFNASSYVGSFSAVNLPPGYQWDTSQLGTNGSIRLAGSAPTLPPTLLITYSNGMALIRFESVAAKHYALESRGALQRSPVGWGQSALEIGTGQTISIPIKVLTNPPQRFFRLMEY
jgi:autotransporter-associated beta strand protein